MAREKGPALFFLAAMLPLAGCATGNTSSIASNAAVADNAASEESEEFERVVFRPAADGTLQQQDSTTVSASPSSEAIAPSAGPGLNLQIGTRYVAGNVVPNALAGLSAGVNVEAATALAGLNVGITSGGLTSGPVTASVLASLSTQSVVPLELDGSGGISTGTGATTGGAATTTPIGSAGGNAGVPVGGAGSSGPVIVPGTGTGSSGTGTTLPSTPTVRLPPAGGVIGGNLPTPTAPGGTTTPAIPPLTRG